MTKNNCSLPPSPPRRTSLFKELVVNALWAKVKPHVADDAKCPHDAKRRQIPDTEPFFPATLTGC